MFFFIHPGYFLRSSPSLPGLSKRLARTGRRRSNQGFSRRTARVRVSVTEQEMLCLVAKAKKRPFNVKVFLNTVGGGRTVATYRKDQKVFSQGDPADSVFFSREGKVKVRVIFEPLA